MLRNVDSVFMYASNSSGECSYKQSQPQYTICGNIKLYTQCIMEAYCTNMTPRLGSYVQQKESLTKKIVAYNHYQFLELQYFLKV